MGLTPRLAKQRFQDLPDENIIADMLNGVFPMDEGVEKLLQQFVDEWREEAIQVLKEGSKGSIPRTLRFEHHLKAELRTRQISTSLVADVLWYIPCEEVLCGWLDDGESMPKEVERYLYGELRSWDFWEAGYWREKALRYAGITPTNR